VKNPQAAGCLRIQGMGNVQKQVSTYFCWRL